MDASAYLNTDHEVAGSIPGTSTILQNKSGKEFAQPHEDNWVAT